jgi:hypothetical protein
VRLRGAQNIKIQSLVKFDCAGIRWRACSFFMPPQRDPTRGPLTGWLMLINAFLNGVASKDTVKAETAAAAKSSAANV